MIEIKNLKKLGLFLILGTAFFVIKTYKTKKEKIQKSDREIANAIIDRLGVLNDD